MAKSQTKAPSKPSDGRSIQLTPYLQRYIPFWTTPGWLEAERWRRFVRNQPIAQICKDTLISNLISMQWSIRAKDPEDSSKETIDDIEWYTDMFERLEGDFDRYLELICTDMLDLPFGGSCERFTEGDKEDGKTIWAEHIDAATLYPTLDDDFPVVQKVPEIVNKFVTFPEHAIRRVYLSPRTEIKRKGWGMAPPEKIYLAMEMLYRGDRYYADLLLDTPEAGILDLGDMSRDAAEDWLSSFRTLFQGIDGMKVPVLYEHTTEAKWIPLNRPPIDLLYDKTTLKYAQITAAGYGLRLSDIGMSELTGDKTLAGVIRGERQSKKSGYGTIRSKTTNHFNSLLPEHIMWVWEDKDEEFQVGKGRAMQTVGAGLSQLVTGGLLSKEEGRQELAASGLLEIEIDPEKVPEEEQQDQPFPFGMPANEEQGQMAGAPGSQQAKQQMKAGNNKVPPAQGGRGQGFFSRARSFLRRSGVEADQIEGAIAPEFRERDKDTPESLIANMEEIVRPGLEMIPMRAEAEPARIRRLVKAATRAMFPTVKKTFDGITDYQIERFWLPEMNALEFDQESELDSLVVRQSQEEIREILEQHLEDDTWWRVASDWDKTAIIEIYARAYSQGLEQQAINILRALYEEGLTSSPTFGPSISFDVVNLRTLINIERTAADMVTNVNNGTKFYIKRIISAGVRKGMSSPRIAQAIREGESAAALLRDDGYWGEVLSEIMSGMIEMSKTRSESIVNFEVKKAENEGILEQNKRAGLTKKAWVHLGKRGVTDKGNPHPCPVCTTNEDLKFVPNEHVFKSVFKKGGEDGKGGILHPPAHPNVCHCRIIFEEAELFSVVGRGEYVPWTGE